MRTGQLDFAKISLLLVVVLKKIPLHGDEFFSTLKPALE